MSWIVSKPFVVQCKWTSISLFRVDPDSKHSNWIRWGASGNSKPISFCYHTRPVFEMAIPLLNFFLKNLQAQFCTWKLSTVCLSRCASKRVQNWDLYLVSSWGFYSLKQIWTLLNPIFPQKMFIHFPTSPWLLYIQINCGLPKCIPAKFLKVTSAFSNWRYCVTLDWILLTI